MIEAVIDIDSDFSTFIKWKNFDKEDSILTNRAQEKTKNISSEEFPIRVFLLGELFDTDFKKKSRGGMQPTKKYFDISQYDAKDAKDLADKLKRETWE